MKKPPQKPKTILVREQEIWIKAKNLFYRIHGDMSPILREALEDWWADIDRRLAQVRDGQPPTPALPRTQPRCAVLRAKIDAASSGS